ncbi:MAG: protein-methionine-sulfoxide reductase heme-binding subunit MsrQ [Cereibacter sphaeroides]|uniref:Protein-methionine-sulfoxide reductase heme-binding subunit MsrQ n=1 Tax=Cereibacter sphaeroides TaxID=1063 RepID=A0A2W5TXJ3_CERSP|nr:MAG: protein-methionine-sulfoxide reductase heme-binding subunit MsrQ [Cereibacter sphaeroides]
MDISASLNQWLRRVPPWLVYLLGLLPLASLIWDGFLGDLGADPVKEVERALGLTGLQFLLGSMLVTPIRRFLGINLIRYRRAIGLIAFFYITLHFLTWLTLDLQLRWGEIGADLVKRPYIILGMIGFLAMIPLAITSNNLSIRRMGAATWGKLHRLAYVAVIAGALHYLILVKAWPKEPVFYMAAAVVLVAMRLLWLSRRVAPGRV